MLWRSAHLAMLAAVAVACSATPDGSATDGEVIDAAHGGDGPALDARSPDLTVFDVPRSPDGDLSAAAEFVVVTFNTGTSPSLAHDNEPDDGYGDPEAAITDQWYGNGLNWPPLIEQTRLWFADLRPEVVVFQEIFWTGECAVIPEQWRAGFVCEGWEPTQPTVAQVLLGMDYQVACHPGKPDKCAAVRRDFGAFRGCDSDLCLEGMTGHSVEGCGSGARVARVVVERADGSPFTLVNFHGSSGFTNDDVACRVQQVEQVFVDLGDGAPGANGESNLVMGDLNTDPGRLAANDASAARWNDFVGPGLPFNWVTGVGMDGPKTYGPLAIDHIASDAFAGVCWHAGVTDGHPPVSEIVYFDHRPAICAISAR